MGGLSEPAYIMEVLELKSVVRTRRGVRSLLVFFFACFWGGGQCPVHFSTAVNINNNTFLSNPHAHMTGYLPHDQPIWVLLQPNWEWIIHLLTPTSILYKHFTDFLHILSSYYIKTHEVFIFLFTNLFKYLFD